MTITALLPDLIAAAVLILFCVLGAKKGMFRTFSGLLSILISLFGAMLLANYGAQLISDFLVPGLQPMVEEKLAEILADSAANGELDLGVLGLIPGVQSLVESTAGALAETLAPAVAKEVAYALAWVVLFVVGFVACKLLCKLVLLLLDMVDQLPGLHFLNHLIGAVLGLLKGFLLLVLVVAVLLWLDVLPEHLVEQTVLLNWLARVGPVY